MLLLTATDETQKHDVAGVVAVISVFVVMLALFGVLIWLAFRTARRGRATWADDEAAPGPDQAARPPLDHD